MRCSKSHSFNDLVGDCEHSRWNVEAERLRGLQVDDQLELSRLLDRHIGRPFSLEDATDIYACQTISVGNVVAIAHQTANRWILAPLGNGRDGMAGSESCDLAPLIYIDRVGPDRDRAGTLRSNPEMKHQFHLDLSHSQYTAPVPRP